MPNRTAVRVCMSFHIEELARATERAKVRRDKSLEEFSANVSELCEYQLSEPVSVIILGK